MTTGWGFYIQGSDQQIEVNELGSRLSVMLDCPVHYPAWGKNLFECKCGMIFPLYLIKGGDWDAIKERHNEEKRIAKP